MARASTFSATLGFFSAARQGRRDDAELGKGLWRRAHDRFNRGLDRYHQVLEGVEDEALYGELVEIANQLSALAPRVRQVCVEAQRRFPSNGLDIPGPLAGVHRALSTAGNSLAMTAEAWEQRHIPGTPYFMINGLAVEGTTSWAALESRLKKN